MTMWDFASQHPIIFVIVSVVAICGATEAINSIARAFRR